MSTKDPFGGSREFGDLILSWDHRANSDHLRWQISHATSDKPKSLLKGILKYKGWNDITTAHATMPTRLYVRQWADFKGALDFLYYELGAHLARGSGSDADFIPPE